MTHFVQAGLAMNDQWVEIQANDMPVVLGVTELLEAT